MKKYFITSTVVNWRKIIKDEILQIIINALKFQVSKKNIAINAFVIMPNHLHLIIETENKYKLSNFLREFHGYTSKQIFLLDSIAKNDFISARVDRNHQIWQATHAIKEVESEKFFLQKLRYIHENPCQDRWRLAEIPSEYKFSSASAYLETGKSIIPIKVVK